MNTLHHQARILIVDDTAQNIQVVAHILKKKGYDLVFACDGKSALEQAKSYSFDLILLDIMMPDMDGYEVCQRLKADPGTLDIPVIFLTALVDDDSMTRGFEAGAVDYVTKPFKKHELLARVKTHLTIHGLQEELRILSRSVEYSPVTVIITGVDGTIQYVNPKFVELTGYSNNEALGQNPRILNAGVQPHQVYENLWETLAAGQMWQGELCNKKKNGEHYWELAFISPVQGARGEITHFVAVKQDITEQKRIDEALKRAKDAADAANRAKSEFLANMSHEIRTPMNAIIGLTHLLQKSASDAKQQEYTRKIEHSSQALLGMINDILDFSKVEAGKLDLDTLDFQLDTVLDNVTDVVAISAYEKGLELLFYVEPDVPPTLRGDPLRLGQVLINLVNNAIKFTESGEVVVSIRAESFGPYQTTLQFQVRDTGIGMSGEQVSRLFQAFMQADSSITRKYGGTGLGLAISKQLVHLMDGDISVQSQPGLGATFCFTAVFARQQQATAPAMHPLKDLRGLRVLVVENNLTSQKIFQAVLQSLSFRVSVSSTAELGLQELQRAAGTEHPYELVLINWMLPGIDGIEASRQIKQQLHLPRIPSIILVTAYGRELLIEQRENADVLDGVLIKPVSRSALFDSIIYAFRKKPHSLVTTPAVQSAPLETIAREIHGARILLVEDNDINQQVGQEILTLAGLHVSLANHGAEALLRVQNDTFDAVLMDIQMPVMDGLEATRRIRQWESEQQAIDQATASALRQRLPIIAMTAHAMDKDREQSMTAGMDAHVTKPLDPRHLLTTLRGILIGDTSAAARSVSPLPASPLPPVQPEAVALPVQLPGLALQQTLAKLGNDEALYRRLLWKFQRDFAGTDLELGEAIDRKDWKHARYATHTIKGVAGNIGAYDLYTTATALEASLLSGAEHELPTGLTRFTEALRRVVASLQQLSLQDAEQDAIGARVAQLAPPVFSKEQLAPLLRQLETVIQKRQPRRCQQIMQEILRSAWPDDITQQLVALHQLLRKYKFREAQKMLHTLHTTHVAPGGDYA